MSALIEASAELYVDVPSFSSGLDVTSVVTLHSLRFYLSHRDSRDDLLLPGRKKHLYFRNDRA